MFLILFKRAFKNCKITFLYLATKCIKIFFTKNYYFPKDKKFQDCFVKNKSERAKK